MKRYLVMLLVISSIVFSSCYNQRYIKHYKEVPISQAEVYGVEKGEYKLQPYDYLYINVKTTNIEVNEMYQTISSTYSGGLSNNESNFFLTGYLISDSGFVFVPTIGKLYVAGKTIEEARKLIQEGFDKILTDAIVNVRLTSFNVTFLGEVNKQGRIAYYRERVNILEAIGSAGGISEYGNKKKVTIIRPQDSIVQIFTIDVTNKFLIEQSEFYLYPNDIIYIPQTKSKYFLSFVRDYSTFISLFTSTITTTLLIIQLTSKQ